MKKTTERYGRDSTESLRHQTPFNDKSVCEDAGESLVSLSPEIKQELIEIDWYKEKREWPDMAIETTIRLVRRD